MAITGVLFAATVIAVVFIDRVGGVKNAAPVVGFVLTLFGAVAGAWRWARRRALPNVSTPDQLDAALKSLAETLNRQWSAEAARRGLNAPTPVRVSWAVTERPVIDRDWVVPRGLTAGTVGQIRELFEQVPAHRLVIIGAVGTGKTAAAVLFLLDELAARAPNEPAPALLSIASWDATTEHLVDFVAAQLARDHRYLRNPDYGGSALTDLVTSGRVTPILDGFDEIPVSKQAAALDALNESGLPRLVLASRADEYQNAIDGPVLAGAAVVELLPVDLDTAIRFLSEGCSPRRLREWEPVFAKMCAEPCGPVRVALTTPLMLSLARQIYTARSPTELLDTDRFADAAAVEDHLLDGFIPAQYTDRASPSGTEARPSRYRRRHALRWFSYLARQMRWRHTYEIAWWDVPLLVPWPRRAIASVLIFVLAVFGLWKLQTASPRYFMPLGLAAASVVGATIWWRRRLDAPPTTIGLASGWIQTRQCMATGLTAGISVGAVAGVVLGTQEIILSFKKPDDLWVPLSLISALLVGVVVGLIAAVGAAVSRIAPTVVPSPEQSIRAHFAYLVAGRFVPPLIVLMVLYLLARSAAGTIGPAVPLSYAFLIGLAFSLVDAGGQYLVAVTLLAIAGRVPPRLLRFLKDAHRRGVLRQQGATYQFRHARLQEHLATGAQSRHPSG